MDWCISLIYGHLSMKWLKREILGHKKGFVSRTFVKKVLCFFLFFSFLFCSFLSFLLSSSSFFFFFFTENEQCEKWFLNRVFGPPFPRFAAKFLQYFSWQLKIKLNMGSARIYRQVANVSPHTYARGFVRQTFIYLFNFFLDLRYNLNTSICRPIVKRACFSLTLN